MSANGNLSTLVFCPWPVFVHVYHTLGHYSRASFYVRKYGICFQQQTHHAFIYCMLNVFILALMHRLLTKKKWWWINSKLFRWACRKFKVDLLLESGQDPLAWDVLLLKDVTSLLALENRLRDEAELKNKMVIIKCPYKRERVAQFVTEYFACYLSCMLDSSDIFLLLDAVSHLPLRRKGICKHS